MGNNPPVYDANRIITSYLCHLCAHLAVWEGLFYGQRSILYRLMRGGFGYQQLFCHALPSHSLFSPLAVLFLHPPTPLAFSY